MTKPPPPHTMSCHPSSLQPSQTSLNIVFRYSMYCILHSYIYSVVCLSPSSLSFSPVNLRLWYHIDMHMYDISCLDISSSSISCSLKSSGSRLRLITFLGMVTISLLTQNLVKYRDSRLFLVVRKTAQHNTWRSSSWLRYNPITLPLSHFYP